MSASLVGSEMCIRDRNNARNMYYKGRNLSARLNFRRRIRMMIVTTATRRYRHHAMVLNTTMVMVGKPKSAQTRPPALSRG
eukprot:3490132-Alexandrium_andersonii.AAC.1